MSSARATGRGRLTTRPITSEREQAERVDVAELLSRWRRGELAAARYFKECGGASSSDLEELFDGTATALLERDYESTDHLRAALRRGIKLRALRLHRDRATRQRTLERAAPTIHAEQTWHARQIEPESELLAHEDKAIICEFLADLTQVECQVFVLVSEGNSWRAIGTALSLPKNEARNAVRACERKRGRFLTLYTTGRLCGYRSRTIGAVLRGDEPSDTAQRQALAHLRHCRSCQAKHKTDAARLRTAFERGALALLPAPTLLSRRLGLLDRRLARGRPAGPRLRPYVGLDRRPEERR